VKSFSWGKFTPPKIEMRQLSLSLLMMERQLVYDIHGEVWIHGIPNRLLKLKNSRIQHIVLTSGLTFCWLWRSQPDFDISFLKSPECRFV
jgi:hypothetical protein